MVYFVCAMGTPNTKGVLLQIPQPELLPGVIVAPRVGVGPFPVGGGGTLGAVVPGGAVTGNHFFLTKVHEKN